jgi:uncharacterized membrane protein
MLEQILELLEHAGAAISLFAVAVVVVGFVLSSVRYALRFRKIELPQNFRQFKIELGRVLTLALEIIVVADVIETITVEPTFGSLSILATLVIARTALSWALALETEGRWPWTLPAEDYGNE